MLRMSTADVVGEVSDDYEALPADVADVASRMLVVGLNMVPQGVAPGEGQAAFLALERADLGMHGGAVAVEIRLLMKGMAADGARVRTFLRYNRFCRDGHIIYIFFSGTI